MNELVLRVQGELKLSCIPQHEHHNVTPSGHDISHAMVTAGWSSNQPARRSGNGEEISGHGSTNLTTTDRRQPQSTTGLNMAHRARVEVMSEREVRARAELSAAAADEARSGGLPPAAHRTPPKSPGKGNVWVQWGKNRMGELVARNKCPKIPK